MKPCVVHEERQKQTNKKPKGQRGVLNGDSDSGVALSPRCKYGALYILRHLRLQPFPASRNTL